MSEDIILKIMELAIIIFVAIIGRYVIPYIKLNIGESKLEHISYWINTFVRAAEMLFGEKTGEEKLNYVIENISIKLDELGVKLSEDNIRALIEDAVYSYTQTTKEE